MKASVSPCGVFLSEKSVVWLWAKPWEILTSLCSLRPLVFPKRSLCARHGGAGMKQRTRQVHGTALGKPTVQQERETENH